MQILFLNSRFCFRFRFPPRFFGLFQIWFLFQTGPEFYLIEVQRGKLKYIRSQNIVRTVL